MEGAKVRLVLGRRDRNTNHQDAAHFRCRLDLHPSIKQAHPVEDVTESQAFLTGNRVESPSIIGYDEEYVFGIGFKPDPDLRGMCVPHDIINLFLYNTEQH